MKSILHENTIKVDSILNDIVYLESDSNCTKAHYYNGEYFVIENDFEGIAQSLPKEKFFKVNESSIINADYLKKIRVSTPRKALLQKGVEVKISPGRYLELVEFMRIKYCI